MKKTINAKNAALAVRKVIHAMPEGTEFHGWELKKKCVELYPELKEVYVATFLREMREYCHLKYALLSRSESLYIKLGNEYEHCDN